MGSFSSSRDSGVPRRYTDEEPGVFLTNALGNFTSLDSGTFLGAPPIAGLDVKIAFVTRSSLEEHCVDGSVLSGSFFLQWIGEDEEAAAAEEESDG